MTSRVWLGSTGVLAGLLSLGTVAPLVAQGAYDGQEDLRPSVFFVFPRATVEDCFQRIGRGEGEAPAPET